MTRNLRNSTSLVLSLTLAVGPTWAQETAPACDLLSPELPCTIDGALIEDGDALTRALNGAADQAAEAESAAGAEAEAAAAAEAEAAAAAEAEAAAAIEAEAQAVAEAAAAAEAEEAAAAEAQAAAAAEAEAQAALEAEAEAQAQAALEAEAAAAEAEAIASEEAAAAAEAEAQAAMEAEAAATEAAQQAAAEAEAQAAADAEAQAAAQTEAELAAEAEEAAAELEAELAAEAEAAEAEMEAEAEVEAETEADTEAEVEAETEAETETEDSMVGEGTLETEESLPVETDMPSDGEATLEDESAQAAPTMEETVEEAPATAAASGEDAEAEVTTEEVAEEDVRTADEDFDTAVTGDAAATAAPSSNSNGGGLSNFERAVLIGLGAVAVGAILSNGDEVVSNSGDRIVVQDPDGQFRVLKNDDVLLRQAGSQVETQQFNDGSTRTVVTRQDGTQVVTIRAADGRVLRRALVQLDGSQVELFDDTRAEAAVDVSTLPQARQTITRSTLTATQDELRQALMDEQVATLDRTFSLRQVRNIRQVRDLAPVVELDSITFATGSAAIQPDQARELSMLGLAINEVIEQNPGAVFLIEGHTDAVGNAGYNLALSDRRAETVALALTEYFDVPAVNLITQGYGESQLKVRTLASEQANRRAVVRNVTRLLQ